jgi:hypothetical protein
MATARTTSKPSLLLTVFRGSSAFALLRRIC